MDEEYNLLDYDEDDLDLDLQQASSLAEFQSDFFSALDAVEDLRSHVNPSHLQEDHESRTDSSQHQNDLRSRISNHHREDHQDLMGRRTDQEERNTQNTAGMEEIFFSRNMGCPVFGCSAKSFISRSKYMRHWNERHVSTTLKYHCSVRGCTTTCRRRYDIKLHIREVHHQYNPKNCEMMTEKCRKSSGTNRGYVDPGNHIFKGRSSVEPDSLSTTPALSSVVVVPASSVIHSTLSTGVTSVVLPLSTASISTVLPITTSSSLSDSLSTSTTSSTPVASSPTFSSVDIQVTTPAHTVTSSTVSTLDLPTPSSPSSSSSSSSVSQVIIPDASIIMTTAQAGKQDLLPSDSTQFEVKISSAISSSVTSSATSGTKISLGDYRLRGHASSDIRTVDYSSSFGIRASQEGSTQTSCLDLKPITLPEIPNDQDELEAYILWLCVGMDMFGRQREAAKQRLNELTRDGGRLARERQERRQLEAENRRLKRELTEAKWRERFMHPDI